MKETGLFRRLPPALLPAAGLLVATAVANEQDDYAQGAYAQATHEQATPTASAPDVSAQAGALAFGLADHRFGLLPDADAGIPAGPEPAAAPPVGEHPAIQAANEQAHAAAQARAAARAEAARLAHAEEHAAEDRAAEQARQAAASAKKTSPEVAASGPITSPEAGGLNWRALGDCESGNDPTAVSSGGLYHGLYQFDKQTWESVGGSQFAPQASQATPQQQLAMAQKLYAERGAAPWPTCGPRLFE